MLGHGLSVFKGTTPERFEVEVLGVLENQKPGGSYILARLSGQNLEKSGVIAGMSGSPVYLDGRLAGAVAFAWPFATEPIAGITPIAAMRAIGSGAPPFFAQAPPARASATIDLAEIVAGRISAGRLDEELERFARSVSNEGRSALLWGASGFAESSRARLARLLPAAALPLAALGGGRRSTIDSDLAPGSSVAALFVDGDLRLAATGTVTDRIGDVAPRLRSLRSRDQRDQHAARDLGGRYRHAERAVVVQARQLGSRGGQLRARPHLRLGRTGRRHGADRAAGHPGARPGRA